MPTKKKRVGFIPREDVMRIIEKMSLDNNLSNSKIINILVEEALIKRGIYYKNKYNTEEKKFISKDILENYPFNSKDMKISFDLQTYEKFLSFLKFQEMINRYET